MRNIRRKVLVDDLNRIVGLVKARTGKIGEKIEYGYIRENLLDVIGIARIAYKFIAKDSTHYFPTFNGNTGRIVKTH